jgi:uncharacterized membrane protein YfcA
VPSLLVSVVAALADVLAAGVACAPSPVLTRTGLVGGYTGARVSLRLSNTMLRIVVIGFGLVAVAKLVLL